MGGGIFHDQKNFPSTARDSSITFNKSFLTAKKQFLESFIKIVAMLPMFSTDHFATSTRALLFTHSKHDSIYFQLFFDSTLNKLTAFTVVSFRKTEWKTTSFSFTFSAFFFAHFFSRRVNLTLNKTKYILRR